MSRHLLLLLLAMTTHARAECLTDACFGRLLGVDAGRVEAVVPLPADAHPGNTVLLQGSTKGGRFAVSEHTLVPAHPPPPAPVPMPLHDNLLAGMKLRSFGVEERVQARLAGGALALSCRPGNKPAGVLLAGPWTMPAASATVRLRMHGHGTFGMQVADEAHARSENSIDMGMVSAADGEAALALPAALDRRQWQQFVINCPAGDATLSLSSLSLEPVPGTAPPRATWIWDATDWQRDASALLDWAHRRGIGLLFITVPLGHDGVVDPARLAGFVRQAHNRHIEVWSVDGDPHMVLPSEHGATVRRVKAYAAYNRAAPPQARLDGIQFDIEPYLLGENALSSSEADAQYLALVRQMRGAAGATRLDFVVPFWSAGRSGLLAGLARSADVLTVMDYRTDPQQVYAFAVPFLDWAQANGKTVRIALEAGPIAPETQRRYHRTDGAADLVLVRVADQRVLVALREPLSQLPSGAQGYRLGGTRELDGSATTFAHDTARLQSLLPALEADFTAWRGFAGMAVHGLR